MTMTAKRFQLLDNETNVAISDFRGVRSSLPLNKAKGSLDKTLSSLDKLSKGEGLDKITNALKKIDDKKIFGDTRLAQDLVSNVSSIAEKAKGTITNITDTVMPYADQAMATYKQVSEQVRESIAVGMAVKQEVEQKIAVGKNIVNLAKDSDIKNIKDLKTFSSNLKKSGYLDEFKDTSRMQSLTAAIGEQASKYNVGGVFSDSLGVFKDKQDTVKPIGDTIRYGCSKNDMNIIEEISTTPAGSWSNQAIPSIDSEIMKSFKIPIERTEPNYAEYREDVKSFMSVFDKKFEIFNNDSGSVMKSQVPILENKNDEYRDLVQASINNVKTDIDNFMNHISDDMVLLSEKGTMYKDTKSYLESELKSIPV